MLKSVIGLLILAADIWAIINIVKSDASTGRKVLWVLVVALFPVVGLVIWFLMGPKSGKA